MTSRFVPRCALYAASAASFKYPDFLAARKYFYTYATNYTNLLVRKTVVGRSVAVAPALLWERALSFVAMSLWHPAVRKNVMV